MNAYRRRATMAGVALSRASSDHVRRTGAAPSATGEGSPGSIGFGALLVWLVLFGAALDVLIGWPPKFPTMPSALPTWSTIEVWLGSAILPTEWLIPAVGLAAWVLWGWTCVFVLLRVTLNALEGLTRPPGHRANR